MANSKAQKSELKFPPLLNLADDRPHVDTSFQNVERLNAPLLNSMLSPVWIKDTGKNMTYDVNGKGYYLKTVEGVTSLKSGDETIIENITNKHFEKTELPELDKTIAYDIAGAGEAYIEKKGSKFIYHFNDNKVELTPAWTLTSIEARAKIIDNDAYFIVYAEYNGTEYMMVRKMALDGTMAVVSVVQVKWSTQSINSKSINYIEIPHNDAAPLIQVAKKNDYIIISLVSKSGVVNDCRTIGFATYFFGENDAYSLCYGTAGDTESDVTYDNTQYIVKKLSLTYPSGTASVQYQLNDKVTFNWGKTGTSTNTITVVWDGVNSKYYYNQNATNMNQLSVCTEVPDYACTGATLIGTQTVTDGSSTRTFYIYKVTEYINTYAFTVKGSAAYEYQMSAVTVYGVDANSRLKPAQGTSGTNPYTGSREIGQSKISVTVTTYSNATIPKIYPSTTATVACYSDASTQVYSVLVLLTWNTTAQTGIPYSKTITNQNSLLEPNVVLDNGNFYALWNFTEFVSPVASNNPSAWPSNAMLNGVLHEACNNFTIADNTITMSNYFNGPTLGYCGCGIMRSNTFAFNQNFYECTWKANNTGAICPSALASGTSESSSSIFWEHVYSSDFGGIEYPGTSRLSNFNYYSYGAYNKDPTLGGASEDLAVFTVGGHRVHLPNSKFHLLINIDLAGGAYVHGISYANIDNQIGTLLTPWQSVDENSYIAAYGDTCVYKDKTGKWIKIELKEEAKLFTILEDRLVIINCPDYCNAIDSENGKVYHYATDYNNRFRFGRTTLTSIAQMFPGTLKTSTSGYTAYGYIRYTATAINPLYQVMPRHIISSEILPIIARYRCEISDGRTYNSIVASNTDAEVLGVDVFYSEQNSTNCKYQYTVIPYTASNRFIKHNLQDLSYPGSTSTSASLTPSIFAEYLNGAGNNDMVVEGFDAYVLEYYDSKPTLVYRASTVVTNLYNNKSHFFCIQGQFYGTIGDKLYSLIYNNGAIAQMDAIIDLGDMVFIGNNPLIAFFFDPATRVIRSFTGDANLEALFPASKIERFDNSWYDETTQSIFAATDAGLLVFSRNNYMYENFKNVTNVQFSNNGITHITSDNKTYDLAYYEKEGFEALPIDMETSFYGNGTNESISIDKWGITLYDFEGNHPSSYITVGVRSINDVTVKSEEETKKITPDMYDKWSNSVLINYNPKLIKGQGIRLYLKTPLIVQKVVAHVMDNGSTITTRHSM